MLSALWFAAKEIYLARKSREWPEVPGIVSNTSRTSGGYKSLVKAEIEYAYPVNGDTQTGKTTRVFASSFAADRMTEYYGIGDTVHVRINPNNTAESYLPSGIEYGSSIALGILGLLFLAFVAFVFVTIFAKPR